MPTIEISLNDVSKLAGKKIPLKKLAGMLEYVKGEIESVEGDRIKVEMADTNRPDLWSTEGVVRELRPRFAKIGGLLKIPVKKSGIKVIVDKNLRGIRPKTVCAVVRGLRIDDEVLFQIIQLQEKICETFGGKRREVALGIYDCGRISPPIYFRAFGPEEIRFVPLDFNREISLGEVLIEHPKGKEYGHLLNGMKKYPVFIDSMDHVLSMPPIINSDFSGKVTPETRDLFIECSGFRMKFLMPALNIMVAALAERGGKVETVDVVFPDGKIETPDFTPKKIIVNPDFVRKISGLSLKNSEIARMLNKSRFDVKVQGNKLAVWVPSYRQDVMHEVDVVEDVIISYGINNIEPLEPKIACTGGLTEMSDFSTSIAENMIGLGAQEIMSYILTNIDNLVKKMNVQKMKVVELDNPVSKNWCVFRTWLMPSVIEFLSKNTNKEYPQNIFEIGEVVVLDPKAETKTRNPVKLAWAYADSDANFTKAKQYFDALMRNLGIDFVVEEYDHPSFIPGRAARIISGSKEIAIVGEIHPKVLDNFGMENPVCAFEADLNTIKEILRR
jgi:phenylalanyl-tRNA synthetase beta chain